jgi:polyhydroxybutyrate depolymerase
MTSDGARLFDVLVPRSPGPNAAVVIDFHGLGGTKERQRSASGLDQLVERDGIVLIYPQGIENSWNGQTCCGTAMQRNIDDVRFARDAMEAVASSLKIQPAVRASSGISNGMAMSDRIACEAGDFFDLVAGVSFQLAARGGAAGLRDVCKPAAGTTYEEFHATADEVVPFDGAPGGDATSRALQTLPAMEAPRALAEIRGCNGTPQETMLNSNTVCQRFSGCPGGGAVGMCTVTPGAHGLYRLIGNGNETNFADRFSALVREAAGINRRGVLRAVDLAR